MAKVSRTKEKFGSIKKAPSGIKGLDEVTHGGLPKGRPTLICGKAGCGKTLMGMEFLICGALKYGEPGVFMSFEETERELAENFSSLNFHVDRLIKEKKFLMDYVHIERSDIEETGEYDLEALFIRLDQAIKAIGAKRVVLDTLEALFAGLPNEMILRAELRRLFRWLKEKGVTAVITGESGENTLTRYGLEEYVADCVIFLDHKINEQVATRRLRVVKYRGSFHGTNEYPFLIDQDGISILPITSLGLDHKISNDRVSSGIESLDHLMGHKGFFKGSTVLVSGAAGTGKTSLGAHFVHAACQRGEKCYYFVFEESPSQIIRNMRSIGINLEPWVKKGLLKFHAARPTYYGLEMHLVQMHKEVEAFEPTHVVVDPISNFLTVGHSHEVKAMLTRLIDFFKSRMITALFTTLTFNFSDAESSLVGVSSLTDTWIILNNVAHQGVHTRSLFILKSRGMKHSNRAVEFLLTDQGVLLNSSIHENYGDEFRAPQILPLEEPFQPINISARRPRP